jgi:6-pyruvoyltetrahydropterin/6-carboxytetrahydropterin synthase
MYELIVEREFSAAHFLRDYDGDCARMHGHNYKVEVSVVGDELLPNGMLLDFGDLKAACDAVLQKLDHRMLNDIPPFDGENATSENLARFIFGEVGERLAAQAVRVNWVRVWETSRQSAIYREGRA